MSRGGGDLNEGEWQSDRTLRLGFRRVDDVQLHDMTMSRATFRRLYDDPSNKVAYGAPMAGRAVVLASLFVSGTEVWPVLLRLPVRPANPEALDGRLLCVLVPTASDGFF